MIDVKEMIRGLVRAAEFLEQQHEGRLYDDECRKAIEAARDLGWGKHKIGTLPTRPTVASPHFPESDIMTIVTLCWAFDANGPAPHFYRVIARDQKLKTERLGTDGAGDASWRAHSSSDVGEGVLVALALQALARGIVEVVETPGRRTIDAGTFRSEP